jgi:hypothetical protein
VRRTDGDFGGIQEHFVGLRDPIVNKRSVGCVADLADCERLDEAKDFK